MHASTHESVCRQNERTRVPGAVDHEALQAQRLQVLLRAALCVYVHIKQIDDGWVGAFVSDAPICNTKRVARWVGKESDRYLGLGVEQGTLGVGTRARHDVKLLQGARLL